MTESLLRPMQAPASANEATSAHAPQRVLLDGRRPTLLDHRGHVLQVVAGHVDLFAVIVSDGRIERARQHLLRIEADEIIPDLPEHVGPTGERLEVIAVGGLGTEVLIVPRAGCDNTPLVQAWIGKLAKVIAGPNPSWEMREAESEGVVDMLPGEHRRGPARDIVWVSIETGAARLMRHEPPYRAGSPPIPLASGMWIEAGEPGCSLASACVPTGRELWDALDRFHVCAVACIRDQLASNVDREAQRLVLRTELDASQTFELFDRLSAIVVRRLDHVQSAADPADPLLAACQVVAKTLHTTIARPAGRRSVEQAFDDVVEIARTSRLRARRTLLRGDWWMQDVGPLVAWHGEGRSPVALVRSGKRYVMTEPKSGTRRVVDRAAAMELAPEAVTFYPTLPSRALQFRDLLTFSLRHTRGNYARIVLAVVMLGLMSLVTPLITQVLVDSVVPRSELDQLIVCAIALAVTAIGMASVQTMEGMAMLRLEGLIDWKLQAAVIDRVLRLPASLFREYTVGDFVDRSLGVDAVRRIFTGRTLRSLMAGVTCWFSIFLMLWYDPKLALIAVALGLVRALLIMGASGVRLYHESRHFNLHGKVGGFVLQLLAGIGKLRVANATVRALAVWSKQFAAQKRHFISSQRTANMLNLVEASFPTFATIVIFAAASATGSTLIHNLGAFLAFFAAFGQTMAAIGAWASGVSESLVAIPLVTRMRPVIASAAEISDDRKPPGELAGAIELSRVTFRYLPGGPPVLDNVSLRIGSGEYVAIVGPSGSGKSSLFRLLLGFEKPESGAVFFDGKALDTLDTSAVRRQLGVVLQNGKLATGSLYDNICGGVQLPLEHAWEAARLAGLDADIKAMPMGMHTVIAEGVNTLSGGQRQRVMIARAIGRRPRILLLDEATSSLDNQTQAIVSASLGALNVTRIVIAHRLSTVRGADRIIVLVDGKVVQSGTFAELSSAAGVFADFTRRQLL
jgi:NHLM bacteriocin system ABC transporter ATP-binding protein